MNVQQAIQSFLRHGQSVRNLSDRTLRAYESDLTQFNTHFESTARMVEITSDDLEKYVVHLTDDTYRETSIRRKVAALKVFFRYLEDNGIVTESPARQLRVKQPAEARVPNILSSKEIRALLAAPKRQIVDLASERDRSVGSRNRYFCAVRDNIIIELLFSTGIRIGELVALDINDVDIDARQVKITGRATRGRQVTLSSDVVVDGMRAYLELRKERDRDKPALFIGRGGTRLTIYSIENIFKKYVKNAEIKRHITPHALRHTMASMLIHNGADLKSVQEMLGHASILSTQVYTKLPISKRRPSAASPFVTREGAQISDAARLMIKKPAAR
jgi:integrase/recombinase XerD